MSAMMSEGVDGGGRRGNRVKKGEKRERMVSSVHGDRAASSRRNDESNDYVQCPACQDGEEEGAVRRNRRQQGGTGEKTSGTRKECWMVPMMYSQQMTANIQHTTISLQIRTV